MQNISLAWLMETEPVKHVRERFRRVEEVRNMLRIPGGGEIWLAGIEKQ